MEEEWRPVNVDGGKYVGLYEVSNKGRVKRLGGTTVRKSGDRLLTGSPNSKKKNSYLTVMLCAENKSKRFSIQKLVANAFIPNPNNFPQINHKDENTHNNEVSNLEWCTAKYNNNYGGHCKRDSESHINHPMLSKQVAQYDLKGTLIKIYPSTMEAIRQTGFLSVGDISRCCSGQLKTYKGFIWRYV